MVADGSGIPDARTDEPDAPPPNCETSLTGWQRVGSEISATAEAGTHAGTPVVAVDGSGATVVAWTEGSPADLYIRRWDGAFWSPVGDGVISENVGNSPVYTPRLAAYGSALVLAYPEAGGAYGTGFYARQWNGSEWQVIGGGDLSTANTNVSGGAITFDGGKPVIAWSQYTPGEIGRNRIQVRRFTGAAYEPLAPELGGVAGPGASAITPELMVTGGGRVVAAFSESGVRTFRRDAADITWEPLGGDSVSPLGSLVGAHSPHLAVNVGGDPVLALAEYDSETMTSNGYLLEWDGDGWQVLAGVVDIEPGAHTYVQDLVVDGEGRPVVAVTEGADGSRLYVLRWNGVGFEDVGTLPLSGYDGVGAVSTADLDVDRCGRVVVAFSEDDGAGGDRAVHVYRYYE